MELSHTLIISVYTCRQILLSTLIREASFCTVEETAGLKPVQGANSWLLLLKEIFILPPLRLEEHCGRLSRNNIRAGWQRGGLYNAVFRAQKSQCKHNFIIAIVVCTGPAQDWTFQPSILNSGWTTDYLWVLGRDSHCLHPMVNPLGSRWSFPNCGYMGALA